VVTLENAPGFAIAPNPTEIYLLLSRRGEKA